MGAGIDVFLAANKVGERGFVIGVDMTDEMIKKANEIVGNMDIETLNLGLGRLKICR